MFSVKTFAEYLYLACPQFFLRQRQKAETNGAGAALFNFPTVDLPLLFKGTRVAVLFGIEGWRSPQKDECESVQEIR